MGCVYKEVALDVDGKLIPKIKVSEDSIKITNPGFKKLYRAYDNASGYAIADILTLQGEKISRDNLLIVSPVDYLKSKTIDNFTLVELQKEIFKDGELVYEDPSIIEKKEYCDKQMKTLYPEVRRINMPHIYPVSGTSEYVELKKKLILEHKSKINNK